MRALAKDPAQRYADADELIVALEHEREVLRAYHGAAVPASYPVAATALAEPPPDRLDAGRAAAGAARLEEEPRPRTRAGAGGGCGRCSRPDRGRRVALVLLLTGRPRSRSPCLAWWARPNRRRSSPCAAPGCRRTPRSPPACRVQTGLVVTQSPPAGQRRAQGLDRQDRRLGRPGQRPPARRPWSARHRSQRPPARRRLRSRGPRHRQPDVAAGIVIGTEPPAGTVDRQGSTVTVLVSSGPALVTVPDVAARASPRRRPRSAERRARQRHRHPRTDLLAAARDTSSARNPKAGSEVRADTKVALAVAEAPKAKKVPVPTVVGQSELSAEEALERAGLGSSVSSVVTGEASAVGKVLRQSPSGGTQVRQGERRQDLRRRLRRDLHDPHHDHAATTTTPTTPSQNAGPGAVTGTNGHPPGAAPARGGARRRALLRARGVAVLRAGGPGRVAGRRATRSCGWRSPATGEWHCDGELLSPHAGARAARGGRRLPRAARALRRGRHRPGDARDARRRLRRLRRGRLGREPRQGALQRADELRRGPPGATSWGCPRPAGARGAEQSGAAVLRRLGLPVFVKPAHLGSSVGIVKVAAAEELGPAIEQAFAHDDRVIVEAAAGGREVECAVLGGLARAPRERTRRAPRGGARVAARGDRVPGRVVRLRGQVLARAGCS